MEKIELNDFQAQWPLVREKAHSALERTGQSGWFILGQEVSQFENELAEIWGLPNAVACANGLDAIELGLRALGLESGDLVLTTPLSAFATTLAIIRAGGKPVFIDTDKQGLLDLVQVEKVLSSRPDIRFMVPVHLYGFPLDLERLAKLKTKFQLRVVEDCAQSIGARWDNRATGSVGEIAATSFYPTKNLGCFGDGGALLMRDSSLASLARQLRDYGQETKYFHTNLGMNSRLDELHAAILREALLPQLTTWTQRRVAIAKAYRDGIKNSRLHYLTPPPKATPVWHLFPIYVDEGRENFQAHLLSQKIASAVHYPKLITEQPALKDSESGYEILSDLSQAEFISSHEISLPIHPFLSDEDVSRVILACNSWQFSERRS